VRGGRGQQAEDSFNVKDVLVAAPIKQASKKSAGKKKHEKTKSIGHYIIGREIGQGTFGKVKLGTHILTGEKVIAHPPWVYFHIGSC
jgi:serine/threonine protein kinase